MSIAHFKFSLFLFFFALFLTTATFNQIVKGQNITHNWREISTQMRRPQLVHCVGRLPRVRRRPVQQDQEVHRGPLLLPRRDGRYLDLQTNKRGEREAGRLTGGPKYATESDVSSEGRARGIATYANEAYKVRGDRVSSFGPGCVNLRQNGSKFTSAVPRECQ